MTRMTPRERAASQLVLTAMARATMRWRPWRKSEVIELLQEIHMAILGEVAPTPSPETPHPGKASNDEDRADTMTSAKRDRIGWSGWNFDALLRDHPEAVNMSTTEWARRFWPYHPLTVATARLLAHHRRWLVKLVDNINRAISPQK